MNETTVAELIQLLQNESASIDMQFQLWLTITSAVLIASFAARLHLSFWMKIFIAIMYVLASVTIAFRYANDASQFIYLQNELMIRGIEYPTVTDLRPFRALLYLFGSAATVVFVFVKSKSTVDLELSNNEQ